MAPIRPTKAQTGFIKPRPSSIQRARSFDHPDAHPNRQNKASTKAYKRSVKHANLLSRLQRTAPSLKVKKRRRPSKGLVLDLRSLEDALPHTTEDTVANQDRNRTSWKIKHESLNSRPGVMKRREKLVLAEKERFAKNLALMAARSNEAVRRGEESPQILERSNGPLNTSEIEAASANRARWAAIRDHIGMTMETMDHKRGLN